jgi:adenylate cyclase
MGDVSQTFLFADLAGFTALTAAHGDQRATDLAEDFAARVGELLPEYGGEKVKTIGDEVMVHLADPSRAVALGLRIVDELAKPGSPPVRVGIHSGPALNRGGDWYGASVNLASRVSGAARPGEVMVTTQTRAGCGDRDEFDFESRGSRHFKHIPDPVPVYRAVATGNAGQALEVDPVCRMAVDPEAAAGVRRRRGIDYYFCSAKCERAFDESPRSYIPTNPAARAARTGFLINLTAFLAAGSIQALAWIAGWSHDDSTPPMFVYVGAVWAIALVLHYRSVRREL